MMNENKIEITDSILMSYINSELSGEIIKEVEAWITASEGNKSHYSKLKKTWELLGNINPKPVFVNIDKAWGNVLQQIESEDKVIQLPKQNSKVIFKYVMAAAAIVVALFSVYQFSNDVGLGNVNVLAKHSKVSETLSDGSEITLNENSMLSYTDGFTEHERRVNLKGEAFFDIERNENKPFIIDLPHHQYVKVLGTSFNIKALDNDSLTTVYVSTGTVEFGDEESKLILVAGETGIINNKTLAVYKVTDKYAETKERYWQNQLFKFEGDNLEEVVSLMNTVFEVQTVIECESTQNLAISSTFEHKSLEYILNVIAETNELAIKTDTTAALKTYIISCNEN
jgi:ferric-dicitrate binding protein FerR (iron transport regulator)